MIVFSRREISTTVSDRPFRIFSDIQPLENVINYYTQTPATPSSPPKKLPKTEVSNGS
jgi:hypothetical protein